MCPCGVFGGMCVCCQCVPGSVYTDLLTRTDTLKKHLVAVKFILISFDKFSLQIFADLVLLPATALEARVYIFKMDFRSYS